ncbi:MAG: tRNA (adenosine(37)-N6)-dimethylallyltransferase MiaA [Bacteroidales bacterium]|nr:tRNA (adenosine(37)-N6)-dimethylallyltransferase MiaA [Bacteroidales bacterium]
MNSRNFNKPTLLVIAGPTAVGKTQYAIQTAIACESVVISADSRQFYKEMKIGTAAPTEEEMEQVPHYFVGHLSVNEYYSASRFEQDVLALLPSLFAKSNVVIMCGGSGLYIDAVCHGIDDLPDPDPQIRQFVHDCFEKEGIAALRAQLRRLDPAYYDHCNLADHKRMMRAVEVSLQMNRPYSEFLKNNRKSRDFDIVKVCLCRPRAELFNRINRRTLQMMEQGFLEEARSLLPYRHLNALNTVGYKELFAHLDGKLTLKQAVTDIQTHTRRYAKRQMTWFNRDNSYEMVTLS